jgi:uncharacterized protein (TIGR02588 family)
MSAGTKQDTPKNEQQEKLPIRSEKNWVEWTVFGISLVLVASILGYLLFLEFVPVSKDVTFDITVRPVNQIGTAYHVPIKIKNESNRTARDVMVEITSANDLNVKSEITFDYVPKHSEREGMAVFENDPGSATVRVSSFNMP